MGVRSRLRVPLLSLSALGLLAAAGACSYHSEYVAPPDGRPRVVWGRSDDVVVELAGGGPSEECGATLHQITQTGVLPTPEGSIELPTTPGPGYVNGGYIVSGGYWTPRYYGAPVFIVTPGIAPRFFRPPIFFSPSLMLARAARPGLGGWRPRLAIRGGGSRGGSFSGGGGGGGGAGKGLVILAALAIMVLPAIDIGLAASTPESSSRSSNVTDLVNAYNDLMRSPGSPCSVYETGPAPEGDPSFAPPALPMPGAVP